MGVSSCFAVSRFRVPCTAATGGTEDSWSGFGGFSIGGFGEGDEEKKERGLREMGLEILERWEYRLGLS